MDIKLEIDAATVQQHVVDAILKSAIGEEIAKAITKALSTPNQYGERSLVDEAVQTVLMNEIRTQASVAIEARRDEIRQQFAEKLSDAVISKLIDKAWESVANAMRY